MYKPKIAAVIEIGSSSVRMHISQWDGHEIVMLDKLEKPTQIGKEVFSTGYISFDTVYALSEILDGFCAKAREYEIPTVHAIATTALREASNQDYVLDRLAIRNKLEVRVLEDAESSAMLIDAMKNSDYIPAEKMLLVYGGTGITDFALLQNDKTVFTHSIKTGMLKISEMLREASDFSIRTERLAEEYLRSFLMRENRMRDLLRANGLVFSSGNLRPLYGMFGSDIEYGSIELQGKTVMKIYESYRTLSIDQICERHNLPPQQGGVLYATLTLLTALVRLTKVKKLFCTQISLADAMLTLLLRPYARRDHNKGVPPAAISSALDLAARYRCDLKHCGYVADAAINLFDCMKEIHGISGKHSLILHIACILHEAGHYTNTVDLQEASFDLIKDAQIYGLTSGDTLLAANIIAPQSLLGSERAARSGRTLGGGDVLFAAKMHALMHLADSLDASHKQKARLCGAELKDNRLVISIQTSADFGLEQWAFRQSAPLFREIFGIVPQLNVNHAYDLEGKQ